MLILHLLSNRISSHPKAVQIFRFHLSHKGIRPRLFPCISGENFQTQYQRDIQDAVGFCLPFNVKTRRERFILSSSAIIKHTLPKWHNTVQRCPTNTGYKFAFCGFFLSLAVSSSPQNIIFSGLLTFFAEKCCEINLVQFQVRCDSEI